MSSDEDGDGVEFDGGESDEGEDLHDVAGNEEGVFFFGSPDAEETRVSEAMDLVAEDESNPATDSSDADMDDVPFSEAAKEAQRRQNAPSSSDDPFDEAFTEVDVDTIDTESVWEELESEVDDPFGTAEEVASEEGARNVHVISKRSFCQRCRYFSEPPEVHCNHEGTEIFEAVDDDRFRVADCPMVLDDDSTIGMNE